MVQIYHRESHDIDIFLNDPQLLPYLNPVTQGYPIALSPTDYTSDGIRSLKIIFDGIGEIDFICCGPVLEDKTIRKNVRGVTVELETPAEIIAKKIYYRGARLQPRDMFDIAAVVHNGSGEILVKALSRFPEKVAKALETAEGYKPALLDPVLAGLNVFPAFDAVRSTAQRDTVTFLRTVLDHSGS